MADERVWGFRNRREQNPSSSAKARARNQGVQMRKKNSRQRLFQTCEALSSSASAVNAYGRLKIQYLCWPARDDFCEVLDGCSDEIASRWLAVREEAGYFLSIEASESIGYCCCHVGLPDSTA